MLEFESHPGHAGTTLDLGFHYVMAAAGVGPSAPLVAPLRSQTQGAMRRIHGDSADIDRLTP